MNRLPLFASFGCLLMVWLACTPKSAPQTAPELPPVSEALQAWQAQKFSMFIHWGLYAIPAGVWEGKQITGYNEQIKGHARIPTEEYRKLAAEFNPVNWNPDSVVLLAKKAGMKSIVITAKHHDGFCLFASDYTEFDVVDATPYKRDIIKELAEACARHDLKFGVYFSIIDWDFPEASPFVSTVENSDPIPAPHHAYNLNQVRELLTNYGEISEIWFDMGGPTLTQSQEMAQLVKELQPDCMISGRIWHDQGDFIVMGDNYQPDFNMGVPWQTPASMFHETWGYRSWQERSDAEGKIKEKLQDLINIVSLGGNYLLNIGPKGDGSIVDFEQDVLEEMGRWMAQNGEAIYETKPSPVPDQSWGRLTSKSGKLYLHIFDLPEDNKLLVRGLQLSPTIQQISPFAEKNLALPFQESEEGLVIDLGTFSQRDLHVNTLALTHIGELSYAPKSLILSNEAREYILTADDAELYHSYSGPTYQETQPTVVKMAWYLQPEQTREVGLQFTASGQTRGQPLRLTVNGKGYVIPDLGDSAGHYFEELPKVSLIADQVNVISLQIDQPENPHAGMGVEEVRMELK